MRMIKWIAVGVFALITICPSVKAQCTGYTITSTSVNVLSPADAAAQGAVTVTLTISAMDGSVPLSHKETIGIGTGNQTTRMLITYKSNNASSIAFYDSWDNGTPAFWFTASGTRGSFEYDSSSGWPSSNVLNITAVATGSAGSSQDILRITTTNQATGIYSYDGVWINAYYQLVSIFGGGSMMNNCGECQGGEIQKCLQATHTPYFDASLTNPESGETQTISNAIAGNVAKAQESVNGTASAAISFLPGDHPNGSTTNKIYCTMFGWVMAQQWNPGIPETEMAVTVGEVLPSSCALTLRFFEGNDDWGIQCNVAWKKPPATADRCSAASQPPDFQPGAVWDEMNCKIPGNCNTSDMPPPNGTNSNYPKYWYMASRGVRIPRGKPAVEPPVINGGAHGWFFPVYTALGYIPAFPDKSWIVDLLNIAIPKGTGLPIDCTYKDGGTSPIPFPF